LARKLTKEIREVIKEGKLSKIPSVLEKIKDILPPESKEHVGIQFIRPIFGFARDNK
jgi:predicted house-cleaning noncanonical NTP pyrophosphatase (MazG superfamily)